MFTVVFPWTSWLPGPRSQGHCCDSRIEKFHCTFPKRDFHPTIRVTLGAISRAWLTRVLARGWVVARKKTERKLWNNNVLNHSEKRYFWNHVLVIFSMPRVRAISGILFTWYLWLSSDAHSPSRLFPLTSDPKMEIFGEAQRWQLKCTKRAVQFVGARRMQPWERRETISVRLGVFCRLSCGTLKLQRPVSP